MISCSTYIHVFRTILDISEMICVCELGRGTGRGRGGGGGTRRQMRRKEKCWPLLHNFLGAALSPSYSFLLVYICLNSVNSSFFTSVAYI